MAHTFTCIYFHVIFGTRLRKSLIDAEVRPRLWSYMGGVARENDFRALIIGGMSEHAHLLLSLKPTMGIAEAVKSIKTASSGWMSDITRQDFKWQEGYAAFTVSRSNREAVGQYIANQEKHHRKMDFAEEWKLLLKKHEIALPWQ
jgi:REP-associated tyrosine transposase